MNQNINHEMLKLLVYSGHVLSETMRLWPPVAAVNRITNEDLFVNGKLIPKETEVSFSIYSAGRSENFFKDPLAFRPERFVNINFSSYNYFPFSLGPRSCIAQSFAQAQAKLILAKIIQNFDYELDPSQSFEAIFVGNIIPKDGVRAKLRQRSVFN